MDSDRDALVLGADKRDQLRQMRFNLGDRVDLGHWSQV